MRRIIFATMACATVLLFSCKKSGTPDNNSSCNGVTDFTITQQSDVIKLNLNNATGSLYNEVSIQLAPGSDPSLGSAIIINAATASLSIDSLGLSTGNALAVYIRSACSASSKSEWIGPKIITLNTFCDRPYSLGFSAYPDGMGLDWQVKPGTNSTSFQVQYGLKNFALGSGTIKNVTSSPFTDASMAANTNYDFYVRSSCSGSLGWSEWAGPYSYLSTANQHLCLTPSNVTYTVERNGAGQAVGANFQWNKNGETNFEYTFVTPSQTVNAGTVYTIGNFGTPTILGIFQDTDYHFYVRAVCLDGSKTAWFGPVTFNIGH